MTRALATYTPRAKPLNYDALRSTIGCQSISGTNVFATNAFVLLCVSDAT